MTTIKKETKKKEVQDFDIEKVHRFVRNFVIEHSLSYNPDNLIEKMREEMIASKVKGGELSQRFLNSFQEVSIALGLSTHIPIAETVKEEYRTFLVEMIRGIEREYDCKTVTEKALAETIGSSHVRVIQYSKELTLYMKNGELSHEKNGYCIMLGKELDRANRSFTTALITLKQLKNPSVEINVKTKNTFISQNQQFNNNQNESNDQQ